MPPYALTADVRELARSVLPLEFSDPEILKEQLAAQARIWTVTKKTDWDNGDYQFEDIKKQEIKLAAIYVLEHYDVPQNYAALLTMWKQEVKDALNDIVESSPPDPAFDSDIIVVASDYESYPASLEDNPNATPYRSPDMSGTVI